MNPPPHGIRRRGKLRVTFEVAASKFNKETAMKTGVGRLATLALGAAFGTALVAVVGHAQNAQNMNGETVGQHFQYLASALPAPYATPATAQRSTKAAAPQEQRLQLPPGFSANLFATGLDNARWLQMAP